MWPTDFYPTESGLPIAIIFFAVLIVSWGLLFYLKGRNAKLEKFVGTWPGNMILFEVPIILLLFYTVEEDGENFFIALLIAAIALAIIRYSLIRSAKRTEES